MVKKKITQMELVLGYFKEHPNRDIEHPEVVDWVTSEWKKRTGEVFRDPDRSIRKLYQQGYLVKVSKGVYRYDPGSVVERSLENFTQKQKQEILKKGEYKCAMCGLGKKEGMELHVDHIRSRDQGGKATIKNGQILCSRHNMMKKALNQTETGKRSFINLHELVIEEGDEKLEKFCREILEVYEKHNMNGHIKWKNKNKK